MQDKHVFRVVQPEVFSMAAAELAGLEAPADEWFVEGLLPAGLTVLAGRPRAGKTWLAAGLAAALARGEAFLGRPCRRTDVLFLALEDSPWTLRRRLEALGGLGLRNLRVATRAARFPRLGYAFNTVDAVEAVLEAFPDIRVVIVDTLQAVEGPPGRRRPDGADSFADLADRRGLAVVLVHHDPQGASEAAADAVWVLTRPPGRPDAVLYVAGRGVAERALALRFEAGRWTHEQAADRIFRMTFPAQNPGPVPCALCGGVVPPLQAVRMAGRDGAFHVRCVESLAFGYNEPYNGP